VTGASLLYENKKLRHHGLFFIEEMTLGKAKTVVAPHFHNFLEFTLIESGRGTMHIGDTASQFEGPAAYVMKPYALHGVTFFSPARLTVFSAHIDSLNRLFKGSLLYKDVRIFVERLLLTKPIPQTLTPKVFEAIRRIRGEDILADLGFFLSLSPLVRSWSLQGRPDKRFALADLMAYAGEHPTDRITLAKAAALTHVSPSQFVRMFKLATGMTFVHFLTNIRLHQAETLLRHSEDRIVQIAGDSGFSSLTHFNRIFRKTYGMSPREFRNKI